MTNREKVLVLDFGGQYNQLIARRVRECNVYCEVKSYKMTLDEIRAFNPIGIIFTGGPNSVYEESSPKVDPKVFELGVPVLGICYGCQLIAPRSAARFPQRQAILPENTEKRRLSLIRIADFSRGFRKKA